MTREHDLSDIYQRYILEAYLGDFVDDFDIEAIEGEITEWDDIMSTWVWRDIDDEEFDEIIQKHDLSQK